MSSVIDENSRKHIVCDKNERGRRKNGINTNGKAIDKRKTNGSIKTLERFGVTDSSRRAPSSVHRKTPKRAKVWIRGMPLDDSEEGEIGARTKTDADVFDLSGVSVGWRSDSKPSTSNRKLETDSHKLKQRQRQIDYGKNTLGYARYVELVKKSERKSCHAWTPDIHAALSKRAFDGVVRKWRRLLHEYDPPVENEDEMLAVPVDPLTRPQGHLKPGEYVPHELAELAEQRRRAKDEAESAIREGRRLPVERLAPLRAKDVSVKPTSRLDASLPRTADMSPGWDAVTPTPFKRAGLSVSRFNADADVDMMDMDCDVGGARTDPESTTKPRSIYDDWEGEDFAGVI
ncbi:Histone RNA stem-loop-binding protein SLBP1/SLBP2 [Ostreococcus tauri]|uniref:Histone RNA stem-loop-binding protein SLBP1/SLBP2 n=1 Tax=Ostreococcus tauri TaxID=70448 RepID=A0A090M7U7_OSTTA|nr:Histone RNA stem-loop-binding protein SLBP1/SLBP2 [Ostreococcus tauri]CEG01108.1 Histone RNA stem-loop-binding protein SLBP1/SLBP2 [Ostreococcus tauri]|eukprot:XP_003075176.2 Histone RNA stem-loop-binding protein SLBP1/SLBP2 [Ostreococcus tauri]